MPTSPSPIKRKKASRTTTAAKGRLIAKKPKKKSGPKKAKKAAKTKKTKKTPAARPKNKAPVVVPFLHGELVVVPPGGTVIFRRK